MCIVQGAFAPLSPSPARRHFSESTGVTPQYVGLVRLLDVEELRVSFATPYGVLDAVRSLSFQVDEGETLGLVGESGAGKSVAMQAMLGLLDDAKVSGSARFKGEDLVSLPPKQIERLTGPGCRSCSRTPTAL